MNGFSKCALTIAIVIAATIPMQSRAQSFARQIDPSQIKDAKAKAAVEEILKKDATVKELMIDDQRSSTTVNGKVTDSETGIVRRRAPESYFRQARHGNGDVVGMVFDGHTKWQVVVNGPATLNTIAETLKKAKKPQAEIDKAVANNKTKRTMVDLNELRATGAYDTYYWINLRENYPLAIADPGSLKLEGETADAWTFSANMKPMKSVRSDLKLKFTYAKTNGQCTRSETQAKDLSVITTMDKITVNPKKRLPESTFQYQPPANVPVDNETESITNAMGNG